LYAEIEYCGIRFLEEPSQGSTVMDASWIVLHECMSKVGLVQRFFSAEAALLSVTSVLSLDDWLKPMVQSMLLLTSLSFENLPVMTA
jgi:hypothetical protein